MARRESRAIPPAPRRQHNLPVQLSTFIGREQEIGEITRLLSTTRLFTLTGAGGCGKTRLALQVAEDSLEQYPDGIWFVDLAPLADPAFVPNSVATVLNVPEQPTRTLTETLVDYLQSRTLLLVLDNCEHLRVACQSLADRLLRASGTVRILATSREALGVEGESTYRVPPLRLPDVENLPPPTHMAEYDAIRLFTERAALAQPGFTVTASNAPAILQVCQRLDGIPLAIEFAAARVSVLTVDEIAARLDDRFRLLQSAAKTLPRHQTLRAAMDWSFGLLSEQERTLLRRLSVFAGGWTLEAAEAICAGSDVDAAAIFNLLVLLANKSLVVAETQDKEARYRLLETVRQYSRDRVLEVGGAEDVLERHANFFLALAEEAEPHLTSTRDVEWMERLERDHDNLRAVLEWSRRSSRDETMLRLANALGPFWNRRGYWSEGRQWLEHALRGAPRASPALRASALIQAAFLAREQADSGQAIAKYEETLVLYKQLGDKKGLAGSLNALAIIAYRQGKYGRATALLEESIALSRESDNKAGIGLSLFYLGICARLQGNYEQAEAFHQESLSLFRALGLKRLTAFTLDHLGLVAYYRGNFHLAKTICEEGLAQFQQLGDKFGIVGSLNSLGLVACAQGDYQRAAALSQEGLALSRELGNHGAMARSLNVLGRVAHSQEDCKQAEELYRQSLTLFGDLGEKLGVAQCLERLGSVAMASTPGRATRLLAAAESLREAIGAPASAPDRLDHDRNIVAAKTQLNQTVFAAAWAEGRAMMLEQAIEYALAPTPVVKPIPSTRKGALTHRELEVATLVARGLTNREIASSLAVSERTVDAHVQHILNKLGFHARTQIAAWSARQGPKTQRAD